MAQKGNYISKKKGAKKGSRKKQIDTFAKKEWFDLRTPLDSTLHGKTLVTRSSAKQNVEKLLLNRCFELNQNDLMSGDDFRKFKFLITGVNQKVAESEFYSMELTTDKARGIIKKWHTLIEGSTLVKTSDGFVLRVFVMGQSKRREGDTKARVYVQSRKVKDIRRVMFECVENELGDLSMDRVIKKLADESVGREIEKKGGEIYPLQNCFVKKVMVVKRPKRNLEEQEVVVEENGDGWN